MDLITRYDARERGLKTYFTGKACKHGHTAERYVSDTSCVTCSSDRAMKRYAADPGRWLLVGNEWRKRNQEHVVSKRRETYRNKHWRERNPEKKMIQDARARSRKKGLVCTITDKDIRIPTTCPVLGIPIRAGAGKPTDNSPTIDRIIPALGYVPGNVIVVSFLANSIKRDASPEQIRAVADFYAPIVQRLRHVQT